MFNNMKIGKRLIIAFVAISILASAAGAISAVIMRVIDTQYSNALVEYGFAQGDIGKMIAGFSKVDKAVHDAVSYLDESNVNTAINDYNTYKDKMSAYFDTVEKSLIHEQTKQNFTQVKSKYDAYILKADELIELGKSVDTENLRAAQNKMVKELEPLYTELYNTMATLMDLKVTDGSRVSDELTQFSRVANFSVIILIIVALVVSIGLGVFVSNRIAGPVSACSERLEKLAKGDLQSPIPTVKTKDEVGMLADATSTIVVGLGNVVEDMIYVLTALGDGDLTITSKAADNYIGDFAPLLVTMRQIRDRLSSTLTQINQSSDQVAEGSEQVSSGAQALSQGATEQASAVEELAATITEISNQIQETSHNALLASQKATDVGSEADESNKRMQEMLAAMQNISDSSSQIGKIIKTIEDIAFQTNILALNAAVEAARAGAAGKGFAVVADEVRNLASKSAEASKSTATLIEGSLNAVNHGTKIADETARTLEAVVEGIMNVSSSVVKISEASKEQAQAIIQVTTGVDQISSVVQTNSATAEESAAASEELSGQSQILKHLVSQFKLNK